MPALSRFKWRHARAPAPVMAARNPLDEFKPAADVMQIIAAHDRVIISPNLPINPPAGVNHSLITLKDRLSSSDYHSFSSDDRSDSSDNYPPRSCNDPSSSSDSLGSDSSASPARSAEAPLVKPAKFDKGLLNNASSTVPFKWEEAPGKPIATRASELPRNSDEIALASPLQLPPKLQPQALHSLLQSTCRVEDTVNGLPAFHQSPLNPPPPPPTYPSPHRLQPIYQSCPFECPPRPQSPYVLQQKLKKVCRSLLRSASWSQPLHRLAPTLLPLSRFACHGNSVDDEAEKITRYDRFFFDKAVPKDLKCSASLDSCDPSLPAYEESRIEFSALPMFDKSQTEDEFASRNALSFLAMEDHIEAESTTTSSPWQPIVFHDRQGSDLCSWPPASIINLHEKLDDIDDDEGFHGFFSPTSSLEKLSRRINDDENTESASSSPRPWFLDFGPHEEESHHVVSKASNKMSLVRMVALIKLKGIISEKVCKLKKKREGAYQQEKSMWSPTLATYLYNNLQNKELLRERTPSLHYTSEDEQSISSNGGHLKINYHLPSTIKGRSVSNLLLDDELVSPARLNEASLATRCPSFSDEKNKPTKAAHRLNLREQLPHEYSCPMQTKDYPNTALDMRDHAHACKGMHKFRKTVQVLATKIKLTLVQMDTHGKKGVRRPSLSYHRSLKPHFPLPPPHK